MTRIWAIAQNTFLEAVRQRFFFLLLVLGLGMLGLGVWLRQLDFGGYQVKFVADIGLGAQGLFGMLLAVVATVQLFFAELDNRTAWMLFARPVRRWEFLFGKLVGIMLLLVVYSLAMTGLLAVVLVAVASGNATEAEPLRANLGGLAIYTVLQWIKWMVLVAATLVICSFTRGQLFAVVAAFMVAVIAHLQYAAMEGWERLENIVLRGFTWLIAHVFPNFQLFNVGDVLLFPDRIILGAQDVLRISGYGLIYAAAYFIIAAWILRKREL